MASIHRVANLQPHVHVLAKQTLYIHAFLIEEQVRTVIRRANGEGFIKHHLISIVVVVCSEAKRESKNESEQAQRTRNKDPRRKLRFRVRLAASPATNAHSAL